VHEARKKVSPRGSFVIVMHESRVELNHLRPGVIAIVSSTKG
jgi:hypothetical protein